MSLFESTMSPECNDLIRKVKNKIKRVKHVKEQVKSGKLSDKAKIKAKENIAQLEDEIKDVKNELKEKGCDFAIVTKTKTASKPDYINADIPDKHLQELHDKMVKTAKEIGNTNPGILTPATIRMKMIEKKQLNQFNWMNRHIQKEILKVALSAAKKFNPDMVEPIRQEMKEYKAESQYAKCKFDTSELPKGAKKYPTIY